MYSAVPTRHTLPEKAAMHLIALLAWPFETLCLWLRRCREKMHDIDIGFADF